MAAVKAWIVSKCAAFFTSSLLMVEVSGVSVAIILASEILLMGYASSSFAALKSGDASARRDLLSYFLDITGLLRILGHVATLGIGFGIGLAIKSAFNLNLTGLLTNPVLQVAAFLFFKSFCEYWMHRWMHRFPVLWEIHKYHHSAEEMNIVTAHRESVVVAPFASLFMAIPFGILGAPVQTFVAVAVILEFHALLVHSRFPLDFGIFERILISPRAHRLHHARALSMGTRNFGFFVSIWDHVFGTYERAPKGSFTIGLENQGEIYNRVPWPREMVHAVQATGVAALALIKRTPEPSALLPDDTGLR